MHCFYCKGGLEKGTTTHVVKLKPCIVIVKNVPCTECVQCGETFFDNDVAMQLEEIVKRLRTAIMEVTIINYPEAA